MDRKTHQKNQSTFHQSRSQPIAANISNKKQQALSNTNQTQSHASKSTLTVSNNNALNFSTPVTNNINNQSTPGNTGKTLDASSTISALCDFEKQQQFRARSIKSKFDESEISDKYVFLDVYPCVECQMPIDLYSICRNFKDMNKDLEWALCGNCQTKILPKLRIKYLEKKEIFFSNIFNNNDNYNKNIINNNESQTPVFNLRRDSCSSLNSDHYHCDESEVLYSPFHLKYNFYNSSFIESRLKLDIDYLKIKFNAIFWNSIWYFKIKDLPYDFISPYAEPLAERVNLATIGNNNVNTVNEFSVNGSNKNINNLNINGFNGNKTVGMNRLDSIQNLISGRNFTVSNSSSSVSVNKNFITMSNNNLNVNANMVNNSSSGADSKNVKFEEDETECIVVNRENEINFNLNERNYSVKDIVSKIAQDDKNKGNFEFKCFFSI